MGVHFSYISESTSAEHQGFSGRGLDYRHSRFDIEIPARFDKPFHLRLYYIPSLEFAISDRAGRLDIPDSISLFEWMAVIISK
jgi:hypothetical protein